MTIKNLYPTQRPSLDLNFARTKRLDPRVDFERFSVGTYVGNDGLIKTAAAGEARFDHNPVTGKSLGLLVEAERANLQWFDPTASVLSSSTEDGPTGSSVEVYERSATGETTSVTASTTWTQDNGMSLSFFVKKLGSGRYFKVHPQGQLFGNTKWTYDYDTKTVIENSAAVVNFSVDELPNGWHRVKAVSAAVVRTSSHSLGLSVHDALPTDGTNLSTGLLYGIQLEQGSFPTSYIPTSGSTVTRAADVASLTNTNVYDTDSFTILNEPYGAAAGGSTLNIVGAGQTPVKRTTVYNQELSQSQINTLVKKDDEFWRWRILGSSFALPSFLTDGQVTVDWGDGTVETLTTSEHTFSDGGGYHDVGFRLDSGTYFRPYINNNATHRDKVIALGPAPESINLNAWAAFRGCSNLEAFDATVDATGGTSFLNAWNNCSLTSFPLIDTSSGTNFSGAWNNCSSLTSFPLIDTSSGTNFTNTWQNCSSLTSFPLIDTSSATVFQNAWQGCSNLTSFPLIDTSSGTILQAAWNGCSSLTSFPLIDTSSGTTFQNSWKNCSNLTSFPLLDASSVKTFFSAWVNCSSLTDFPANFFDSWTGTPANNCFVDTWDGCSSLTATSVENILNSIDTSGQSAPASGVDITIDYDAGTGTPSVSTAVTNLKSRGWTITLNGVAQ